MRYAILLGLLLQTASAQAQTPKDLALDAPTREARLTAIGQRHDSLYAVPAIGQTWWLI